MKRALAVAIVLGGCAPSLSNMQPAHVAPKGHLLAEAGMDISVPTGALADVLETADTLEDAARSRKLTDGEKLRIFDAGAGVVLNPPGFATHFGVAYSLFHRFELSLRHASAAWRAGARFQILEQAGHGVDLTAGVGFARYVYELPVPGISHILEVDDFKRWQIDFPILVGRQASWYRWWAGPRIMLTSFSAGLTLGLPGEPLLAATVDGKGLYYGVQVGGALGFRYAFAAFELTLAQLRAKPHLEASMLGSRDVDVSSFIVYPSVGLLFQF